MSRIYELISNPVFDDSPRASSLFEEVMGEEISNQIAKSQSFSNFLNKQNWQAGDPIKSLPFLPVAAFKHQASNTQLHLDAKGISISSSGTSGVSSSIFVDQETSRRQKLSVRLTLENFLGTNREPALVFDSDPRNSESVGARQAAILGYIRNASSVEYLLQEKEGLFRASESWRRLLSTPPKEPVVVVGFTFVLWKFLAEQLANGTVIKLPKGSKLIHIGGWKKLESQKVSNAQFNQMISTNLGIELGNIHDVYGFTELMGVSFIECSFGQKHVPKWVRASSLNPRSLIKQDSNEPGLLAFQSPIAHSYLGLSIVTDDLGYVTEGSTPCLCGRPGQTLRVTGRRNKAEIRGCGDILGATKFHQGQIDVGTSNISMLFPTRQNLDIQSFQTSINELRNSRKILSQHTLSEKLETIEVLRRHWIALADADASGVLRKNGIGFLVEWSNPERLRRVLDDSLPGGRAGLDFWVDWNKHSGSKIRSVPRGLLCQWVSGNVPALGMFPIIYSWLTNNGSLSRLSTKAFETTVDLLAPLVEVAKESGVAQAFIDTTQAVTFDHNNIEANRLMSTAADTVIAWGGQSAIEAISQLPMKPDVRSLYFGPRTSFSVVFDSAINSDSRLNVIARRLVADSTVFEQAACASPHSVFIVSEGTKTLYDLAAAISKQFSSEATHAGASKLDEDLESEIGLYRARRLLDADVIRVGNYATLIIPENTKSLPEPVFGRTLHLVHVKNSEDLQKFKNPYLQSVSIAGTSQESQKLAEILIQNGVKRFPMVGKITNFENPWDGEDIIMALVRNPTLGGP